MKTDCFALEDLIFRLRKIEYIKEEMQWQLEHQFTNQHILLAVVNGTGDLTIEKDRFRFKENKGYWIPPEFTFEMTADSPEALELYLFRFDIILDSGTCGLKIEKNAFPSKREIPFYPSGKLISVCDRIFSWAAETDELERYRGQLAFQKLMHIIMKNMRDIPEQQSGMEKAKSYMEANFHEELSIEELAGIAEVSPKYFVDLFKKMAGCSAMDYLTGLRIDRAKQLMAQQHVKLRDIAHQVGYQDEFYFSRKFKQESGVTPTVYMKRRRRKIAVYKSSDIGQLLPMNIIPYAAPLHPKWSAYYYSRYRKDISLHLSAYRVNQHWESNLKLLRQSKPDLIISDEKLSEVERKELGTVSDVLHLPSDSMDWRQHMLAAADYLGEREEAGRWLDYYEYKAEAAREQIARMADGQTFLILRIYKQQFYLHSTRSMKEVLTEDLKLTSAHPMNLSKNNEPISLARLAHMDADRLLLMICHEPETIEYWNMVQQSMEWQELKAVRHNRVHFIPSDPWFEYSASAHQRIIDASVRLFTGNRPK
ncbi:helix-turn-helix domain-containing protein [Cytobacillus firmus]|uniref:helix-turn-helix domain-containing protein n=1 Tax=Cytobacillus firmus TaxID=1399 RepID=UPI001C8D2824|nr:AraC family transcriptional regulator [Cytobacillus firmus]MBX9975812.1 AraC family transcriptional regulator [Cytobacillus firmus]